MISFDILSNNTLVLFITKANQELTNRPNSVLYEVIAELNKEAKKRGIF